MEHDQRFERRAAQWNRLQRRAFCTDSENPCQLESGRGRKQRRRTQLGDPNENQGNTENRITCMTGASRVAEFQQ